MVKSARWMIVVRCLSCQHRGVIAEGDFVRFGVKPGAPVAKLVKRLRCRQSGIGSVMAQPGLSESAGPRFSSNFCAALMLFMMSV
jgi:hypothetical protein